MKSQIQPTAVCYCGENCAQKLKNSKEGALYNPSFRGGGEGNSNSFLEQSDRNKSARPSLRFQKPGKQQNNKVKLLEKYNVFINSYYPTVHNNPSNDHLTKKLQKACGNKIINCDFEKYENKKSYHEPTKPLNKSKNTSKHPCEHKKFALLQKNFQSDLCSEESFKTGFTSDSKTYTVHSETSNSVEAPKLKKNEMKNGKYVERLGKYIEEDCNVEDSDRTQEYEYTEDSFVCHGSGILNCEFFSHLYERIEVLENLILRTIDKTSPQEKKIKSRKNQQTSTSKLELGVQCNELSLVKKTSKEGKKMSVFDLELQKIKKRLRALEKKISEGKKNVNLSLRSPPSLNDISILTEELLRDTILESEKCTLRGSEQNLSTTTCLENHSYSATAVFSQVKLDYADYLRRKKLDPKEYEAKKPFISKCKQLKSKCSSILNQKRPEAKELALHAGNMFSTIKKLPKGKKKELPLLPIFQTPSIKSQLKRKDSMTKVMYVNKRLGDNFMKESVKRPLKKKTKTKIKISKSTSKKQSKSSFLCQKRITRSRVRMEKEQEEELQVTKSFSSVGSTNSNENDLERLDDMKTLPKCVEPSEPTESPRLEMYQEPPMEYPWPMLPKYNPGYWPPYPPFWVPLPPPEPYFYHGFPCTVAQTENGKKMSSLQDKETQPEEEEVPPDPVKILKSGGEIKIPVLFEQVQKSKNKKEVVRKPSDISMRFVVMNEEDKNPLAPLRRIIKKLSRVQNKRTQHYVFGVTKCCCDEQSLKAKSNSTKKLGCG